MQLEFLVWWTCCWVVLCTLWEQFGVGSHVAATVVNTDNSASGKNKQQDRLFPNVTHLYNAKLTCENGAPSAGSYPTETWSCNDMKINGSRLRYWYITGFGEEKVHGDGDDEYNMKNDYRALCEQLLIRHGITKSLWAAFVDQASSRHTAGPRVIFLPTQDGYTWQEYPAGRGFVITLRCMTKE